MWKIMIRHPKSAALFLLALGVLGAGAGTPPVPAADKPERTDGHGDQLPPGALARMGTIRWRHGGTITFVAFTPDGKGVITAGQDDTLRLWDRNSGKEIRRYIRGPAGNLIQGGGRGPVMINNFWSGAMGAASVAVAPNGKVLASASQNAVHLWDVETGKELRQIQVPAAGMNSIAFAPDSKTLVSRGQDQVIHVFDVDTGKSTGQLKKQQGAGQTVFFGNGSGVVFAPDGKTLVTTEANIEKQMVVFALKFWDVAGRKEVREIKLGQNGISSMAFAPDGKVLTVAHGGFGGNNGIALYDPATGKEIRQLDPTANGVSSITFSRDGKMIAGRGVADGVIRLWDPDTGKVIRKLGETVAQPGGNLFIQFAGFGGNMTTDLAFSPDGKTLAAGASNKVRLFDVQTGKEQADLGGHTGSVAAIAIASDGKTLISRGADGTLRRWDAASGNELSQFTVPGGVNSIAFAPDGQSIAAGRSDSSIQLLDATTGKELRKLQGHANGTAVLVFSPDGKTLASRGGDNQIRLYEVATGKDLRQITVQADNRGNPGGAVVVVNGRGFYGGTGLGLVFSPDGKLLASPGANQTLRLWDVATGKEIRQIALPKQRGIGSFAFSPDGRVLATENTDQTVSLWEVASGRERGVLGKPAGGNQGTSAQMQIMVAGNVFGNFGLGGAAPTLAFSPDGRALTGRGPAHAIRVWDVHSGAEIRQFKGHQGEVTAVAVAPDGKTVASASSDTTILVWDVSTLPPASKPEAVELSAGAVTALWTDLAGDDATKAAGAIQKLATAPTQTVALLKEHLKPAPPVNTQQIDQWIADLDSEKFTARKTATEELEKVGAPALPALKKVLGGEPSLETRKRAEALVERLTGGNLTTDQLRLVRAVEALEMLGTPEAKQLLETLAKGADGALPTIEANKALSRLTRAGDTPR
jgi:WD40 repeat protein